MARINYIAPFAAGTNTGGSISFSNMVGDGLRLTRVFVPYYSKISTISCTTRRVTPGTTVTIRTVVYSDNAGSPGQLITYSGTQTLNDTTVTGGSPSIPFNQKHFLEAGYYWIGIHQSDPSNGGVELYRYTAAGEGSHVYNNDGFATTGSYATIGSTMVPDGTVTGNMAISMNLNTSGFNGNNTFKYAKPFTIDSTKVSGGFAHNFAAGYPLLVKVTDPDLKSMANGGKVADLGTVYSSVAGHEFILPDIEVRNNGYEKANRLHQQLEYYDPTTGEVAIWVHLPNSSFVNQFYLCYGHPSYSPDVYNDPEIVNGKNTVFAGVNYAGVYHFNDLPDGNGGTNEHNDSSTNNNDGGSFGSMTSADRVAGKIGYAIDLDGVDDHVVMNNLAGEMAGDTTYTISFWYKSKSTGNAPANEMLFGINTSAGANVLLIFINGGTNTVRLHDFDVQEILGTTNVRDQQWHNIVYTRNGTSHSVYVDGIHQGTTTANHTLASTDKWTLGAEWDTSTSVGDYTPGYFDEVWIRRFNMSDNQILTQYNNQNSPETFLIWGTEDDDYKRYWVPGGTGNYYSSTNWSKTSGGASGASYPGQTSDSSYFTDVIFDANSVTAPGTVINFDWGEARNITVSGVLNNPTFENSIYSYNGNVYFQPGMNFGGYAEVNHYTDGEQVTFDPNGVTLQYYNAYYWGIYQDSLYNQPGKHTVLSDITCTEEFNVVSPHLEAANINITTTALYLAGNYDGITWDFTGTTITMRDDISVYSTYTDFYTYDDANQTKIFDTMHVIFNTPSAKIATPDQTETWFNVYAATVGTLEIVAGDVEVWTSGGKTTNFKNIIVQPGGNFKPWQNTGEIKVLENFTALGTSGNPAYLVPSDAGFGSTLTHDPAAIFTVDYAVINNVPLSPGTRDAGDNTVLYRDTSGWTNGIKYVSPDTFDNTEAVGDLAGHYFAIHPDTIAPATAFGDTYIFIEPEITPGAMPGAVVSPITVSHFNREIDLETVDTATVVSDVNIFNKITVLTFDTILSTTMVTPITAQGELAPNDTAPTYPLYANSVRALRNIEAAVMISFERQYDADAELFEVGVSAFDEGAVWRGNGTTIQEWDKFDYTDYTDKLLGFEYHFEQDELGGMVLGMADIKLANYDDMFSPYGAGALAPHILPNRPLRLYAGYKQNLHQIFVGQTMRLPETNAEAADFHAKDFIASFADVELSTGRTYVNMRTDQIINDLLQNDAGLSPVQYSLDVGENTIGFINFKAGTKIGKAIRDLAQAELGRVYQEYDGGIHFKNRTNKTTPTAILIRDHYVYGEAEPDESNVINRVKINADVREVQASQQIYPALKEGSLTDYEDFSSFKVEPGQTVAKFFDFKNPVTSYTHPVIGGGITANSAQDGTGTNRNADLSFAVDTEFTESVKYTFTNNGATDLYVTQVTIQGTPAVVVEEIRINHFDQTSIDKYGEKVLELDNDCFTDRAFAQTIAEAIVTAQKDAPSVREITMKGLPYMNVGDVVEYYDGLDYIVDEISGTHSPENGHTQKVRLRRTV